MLSPGFSIPSISATPLHQMDADQQIVPNPVYHPAADNHDLNHMGMPSLMNSGNSPATANNANMIGSSHPTLPTAHKQMQSFQSSSSLMTNGGAPQSLMQPQTPVSNML